jgi:transcriptional regulator with XRE-family HTH domain
MPQVAGTRIREARRKRGIRVGAFATRVGISTKHLDNVEAGRKPASIELLNRIATELGIERAEDLIVKTPQQRLPQAVV